MRTDRRSPLERETIICPCGAVRPGGLFYCDGHEVSRKTGHVRGCICYSCTGRRNRKKGLAAQRQMHRNLGGQGPSPTNEESAAPYEIRVKVESKSGDRVPSSFAKFMATAFFRRALDQAERAIPVGMDAMPAVRLQLPGSRQGWLIVKERKR